MKFKCSYDELVPLNKIVPNPKNPNRHPDRQVELLAKIIDYQGQRAPIVVSKRSGFIIKGHCRLEALKSLKWSEAAVDYQEYESEAQEYADMVADNKIAELAQYDELDMVENIKDIGLEDFELLGLDGYSLPEVEKSSITNSSKELSMDSFDNFDHKCPKCSFEWSD
jgi:ParB-like chromosome segregation protein Spo0J